LLYANFAWRGVKAAGGFAAKGPESPVTIHPCWTWQLEQCIPSRTKAAEQIIDALLAQLEVEQWDSHEVFGVQMAVEEALVNAIKHGNKEDPAKTVRILVQTSPDQLRVEIIDEGPGFDPGQVPDPTSPELLNKPHGRGLMLIHSYMTHVEYKGRGNELVMQKKRR
jgi:serine/threonine-protein kinase RsbW